jgi:hypothetical protein
MNNETTLIEIDEATWKELIAIVKNHGIVYMSTKNSYHCYYMKIVKKDLLEYANRFDKNMSSGYSVLVDSDNIVWISEAT